MNTLRQPSNHSQVGRPRIGVRRQLKLTLPSEDWEFIEEAVSSGSVASMAEYFRQLHENAKNLGT